MKASDIPDQLIFDLIAATTRKRGVLWDIQAALPQYPANIVRAKLRQMVAKGRLKGCACGCRGDFYPA